MNIKKAVIAVLLASVAMAAVPAEAQRYFSRSKLNGVTGSNATSPTTPSNPSTSTPTPTPPAQPDPAWVTGDWGSWSSTCSQTATRTRTVSCELDGTSMMDHQCTQTKPPASEVSAQGSGCSQLITNGSFAGQSSANWSLTGGAFVHTTDKASLRHTGHAMSQTTWMPSVAGRNYTLRFQMTPGTCSGCPQHYRIVVTSGGATLLTDTENRPFGAFPSWTITGTGHPISVSIANINGDTGFYIDDVTITSQN